MSIKKILEAPNKILTEKSQKISQIDLEAKEIIKDLIETAVSQKEPEAAGLAAPQIGFNKRIILVRDFKVLPDSDKLLIENKIMINPKIVSKSKQTNLDWESCLSIPYMYGQVNRADVIKVVYQDEDGKEHKIKAKDFFARVIQHEIDHLDGILFTERMVGKLITEAEYNRIINEDEI